MDIPISAALYVQTFIFFLELHAYQTGYVAGNENLALRKTVHLSSQSGLGTPGIYAVNGKRSGYTSDGCARTDVERNPWMAVDLGEDYLISSVLIINWKYPEEIIRHLQNASNIKHWNTDLTDVYIDIGRSKDDMKAVWFHNGTIEFNETFESEAPIYGNWTNWGEWSPCTKSCGNGTMPRLRSCKAEPCCGSLEQTASCNTHACSVCCCTNGEPRDCQDIKDSGLTDSGVYHVTPLGSYEGVDVYCDKETDGGGWLVFQRRVDSINDFDRNWLNYTSGFGEPSVSSNFWLGLRHLYKIVSQGRYELRITNLDNTSSLDSIYGVFKLGDSGTQYQLTIDDYYGTSEDILSQHNGQPFATEDRPLAEVNCTQAYQGGWWLNECAYFSLNGNYEEGGVYVKTNGDNIKNMKKTEMKIRRG